MTTSDQRLVQGNHFRDMVGGTGLDVRRLYAEGSHICIVDGFEPAGELINGLACLLCRRDDFVFDIGDVGDICNLWKLLTQESGEEVKDHRHPGIPNVSITINRRSARINPHMIRVDRDKIFFASLKGVIELEGGHGVTEFLN